MSPPFLGSNTDLVDAFMKSIPHVQATGMTCDSMGGGAAVVSMPANPAWVGETIRGTLHPGCATGLADTACAMAVSSLMNPIGPLATLDLRMDFLRPAIAGLDLVCEAKCIRLSSHVGFAQGLVFQTGQPEPVATVNANMMLGTAAQGRRDVPGTHGMAVLETHTQPQAAYQADTPALPAGWSPYVDYLEVRRHTRLDADTTTSDMLFRLPFRADLIGNPILPAIHGGVVAAFAQTAGVLHLVYSNGLPCETTPRGVDFGIDYLRSAKPIDTWARCTTVRQGNRVALVQIVVWQDEEQRPIASARTQCLLPRINR
jgi:uncharacterized protein (TIGR00369 family)